MEGQGNPPLPSDQSGPQQDNGSAPPLTTEEALVALAAAQQRLETQQAANQAAQAQQTALLQQLQATVTAQGPSGSRSYADAAGADGASDPWQDDARKLERLTRVAGRLAEEDPTTITAWLHQVEDLFGYYAIHGDAARVTTASLLLGGKISAYWLGRRRQIEADILSGVRDSAITWPEFCGELRRRWPEHGTPYYDPRRALFDLRMEGNGVPRYTQHFTQLLAEADPAVDPLSGTEVFLRGLPANVRTEVERVRPTTGWDPATALYQVQQELQRLYDANIVQTLLKKQQAPSGGSGNQASGSKGQSHGQQKRKGQQSLERDAAEKAHNAKIARCMKEKLCFHCTLPLETGRCARTQHWRGPLRQEGPDPLLQ